MLTLSCIIESRRFLKSGSLSNAREKDFLLLFLLFFSFLCFPFHCWDEEKKRRRVTFRLIIERISEDRQIDMDRRQIIGIKSIRVKKYSE